uniref:Uncharacterized protein n=1 Tax=Romanomermis culicivorax TaxID=13658 RepID=A0A915IG53_ROMCU
MLAPYCCPFCNREVDMQINDGYILVVIVSSSSKISWPLQTFAKGKRKFKEVSRSAFTKINDITYCKLNQLAGIREKPISNSILILSKQQMLQVCIMLINMYIIFKRNYLLILDTRGSKVKGNRNIIEEDEKNFTTRRSIDLMVPKSNLTAEPHLPNRKETFDYEVVDLGASTAEIDTKVNA